MSRGQGPGHDVRWLRAQLRELATSARAIAKEYASEAKAERDDLRQRFLEGCADGSEHYANEARRILRGLTTAEDIKRRIGALEDRWTR